MVLHRRSYHNNDVWTLVSTVGLAGVSSSLTVSLSQHVYGAKVSLWLVVREGADFRPVRSWR